MIWNLCESAGLAVLFPYFGFLMHTNCLILSLSTTPSVRSVQPAPIISEHSNISYSTYVYYLCRAGNAQLFYVSHRNSPTLR